MLYWVIIGILIAAIIAVIFFTISKLLKEKKDYNPAKISESSNNSKSVYLVNYTNREIN